MGLAEKPVRILDLRPFVNESEKKLSRSNFFYAVLTLTLFVLRVCTDYANNT
jgi:hypothetical protein